MGYQHHCGFVFLRTLVLRLRMETPMLGSNLTSMIRHPLPEDNLLDSENNIFPLVNFSLLQNIYRRDSAKTLRHCPDCVAQEVRSEIVPPPFKWTAIREKYPESHIHYDGLLVLTCLFNFATVAELSWRTFISKPSRGSQAAKSDILHGTRLTIARNCKLVHLPSLVEVNMKGRWQGTRAPTSCSKDHGPLG